MCNQSVEVEIPCYKYSKRLKRQVTEKGQRKRKSSQERRREERSHEKCRRRKEKEESREEKEESREEKRTSSQLSRPPDTSSPRTRLGIAGIFQLSGAKFRPMRWAGNSCCLDSVFMMGLLEWQNRCKKFQRNIETLLRATGTPRQMSFQRWTETNLTLPLMSELATKETFRPKIGHVSPQHFEALHISTCLCKAGASKNSTHFPLEFINAPPVDRLTARNWLMFAMNMWICAFPSWTTPHLKQVCEGLSWSCTGQNTKRIH